MKRTIFNISKRLRNLLATVAIALVSLQMSSCADYLDISDYFDDELKLDSVFASARYTLAYTWGIADLFPDEGALFHSSTPGPLATDEAFTLFASGNYPGMAFVLGEINSETYQTMNTWTPMYKAIRKCNTVFARIGEVLDMTSVNRNTIIAYARFFRGYAYYRLLRAYGPPILLGDNVLETNEAIEYYDHERATFDETVEAICADLEQAAILLPQKVTVMEFGKPTRGAAYALIARVRLMQASPLFNGGQAARTYFSKWKRASDGVNYVSQTYREELWAIAAAACKRVMDMEYDGKPQYRLYTVEADDKTPTLPEGVTSDPNYYKTFPEGAAGIDPLRSYHDQFNGEAVPATNPEYIWAKMSSAYRDITKESHPISAGGWNGMCIPQKIIDNYRMVDGRTISNSSEKYPYSEDGFTPTSSLASFSNYKWAPSTEIYNMYVNREPRFYACVGFSECFWPNSSITASGLYNITVKYYYDASNGKSAANNPIDYSSTGYVVKKSVNPVDSHMGRDNARVMDKAFGMIRYADVLLMYAEALNNLTTTHTITLDDKSYTVSRDINAMKTAFNQVRYRAGIPGMSDEEAGQPDVVQALIEQERMIELLHEDSRYFDVRRWGKYEESENEPIMGMNADATKESFYQRVIPNTNRIAKRIVDRKLVFLPIPKWDLKRLPSCEQNPGWD